MYFSVNSVIVPQVCLSPGNNAGVEFVIVIDAQASNGSRKRCAYAFDKCLISLESCLSVEFARTTLSPGNCFLCSCLILRSLKYGRSRRRWKSRKQKQREDW